MEGWQKVRTNAEEIEFLATVYPAAPSTGILTKYTPAIDIDILIPEAVEDLVRDRFEGRG